ncbi:hypothetical protein OV079_31600 [Nannocystis pusilla]|uniref:Uncharacterized protein n=1 Tax=Nannocystis pusilla TaxID=889268 RepID=A0A9X3J0G5_9BACT|nr:hypothetical protein [Nannocystis pusilla]MCY1010030.1 hypothetical protein [Nannocystis pusilla]
MGFITVALLVRILLDIWWPDTNVLHLPKRILEGLVSSAIVTFGLGLVVHFGTRQLRKAEQEIQVIPAVDIHELFSRAQRETTTWYFKGGLGRYLTATALPQVLKNKRSGYRFRAYIVDPFNVDLCKEVAKCRRHINSARVRIETLTTIVEYVRQVHDRLPSIETARCGLIDDFAPLRTDLTDIGAILTHDNPTAPAVFHKDKSLFCEGIRQELTTGPNSYREFDVRILAKALDGDACEAKKLTNDYVRRVLAAVVTTLDAVRPSTRTRSN